MADMKLRLFLLIFLISACSLPRKTIVNTLDEMEKVYQDHTGFVLYDPEEKKYLIDYQGDRYFTPASNTKILTFYTALKTLPDSLPGIAYVETPDSLIFWGTGDPSLLYEDLPESQVFSFLTAQKDTLYLARDHYDTRAFGPGWSWDDYPYPYSSERSDLPVYGNTFTMRRDSLTGYLSTPQPFFRKFIWLGDSAVEDDMVREQHSNKTTFSPGTSPANSTFTIPFIYSREIAARLLSDTLRKTIIPVEFRPGQEADVQIVNSIPRDSALTVMMQQSDNFIAEQLMMMAGYQLTDTLSVRAGIEYVQKNLLTDIPHEVKWVDGSGLSRYNLITPKSVVWLWEKIISEYQADKILPMLASGGGPGTLENWYVGDPPFIYGKTGTLSNNHNVSGIILTKKGNRYLFSFMNNNYPVTSSEIKVKMEQILRLINDKL